MHWLPHRGGKATRRFGNAEGWLFAVQPPQRGTDRQYGDRGYNRGFDHALFRFCSGGSLA
jgi:hypothetical protein